MKKLYYRVNYRRVAFGGLESSGPFETREMAERCGLAYAALGYSFEIVELPS